MHRKKRKCGATLYRDECYRIEGLFIVAGNRTTSMLTPASGGLQFPAIPSLTLFRRGKAVRADPHPAGTSVPGSTSASRPPRADHDVLLHAAALVDDAAPEGVLKEPSPSPEGRH